MKMRGVTFDWKANKTRSMGVIAQEVENVIPEIVDSDEKGEKTVSYNSIIGLLIEAIKEQQEEIENLKIRLNKYSNEQKE